MTSEDSSLLERAERSKLSPTEVSALADRLSSPGGADRYTLLHALGHAGDARYAPRVDPYLHSPDDPMLARIALQVLCDYWQLAAAYRVPILRFIHGVSWDVDSDGYVRLAAISSAGDLMATTHDSEIAAALLEVFDRSTDMVARDAAYSAMIIGTGGSRADVPRPNARSYVPDPEVLIKVRRLAEGDTPPAVPRSPTPGMPPNG